MSLTLSTATTEVRYLLNESTASFWSDTEIENWIKEGCLDITSKGAVYEDSQDISLVTNQLVYTSSDESWIANVGKVYAVYYDDGSNGYTGLIQAHPKMLNHLDRNSSGEPVYWMYHHKSFYIWPIPSANENGNTVTVLHTAISNDITNLEDEYQYLAVKYAAAMALFKDRRAGEAQLLLTHYINSLNFERADKFEPTVDNLDEFQNPDMQTRGR